MKRWLLLTAVVLAALVALGAGYGQGYAQKKGKVKAPVVTTVSVTMSEYKVKPKPASAKAGKVTFQAKNTGSLAHELVVLQTKLQPKKLPVKDSKADEAASGTVLGRIKEADLGPGNSASLTLDVAKGSYVLLCNVVAHYGAGMVVKFQVS